MISRSDQRTTLSGLAVVLIFCVLLTGCWDSHPETIPVAGKVTLNGGAWPKSGLLSFLPIEPAAGYPRRAGTATFAEDGTFRAKTWEKGDGLTPGKYKVTVECWKQRPKMMGPPPISYVDEKFQYGAASDLILDVPPDSDSQSVEWNITGPKR